MVYFLLVKCGLTHDRLSDLLLNPAHHMKCYHSLQPVNQWGLGGVFFLFYECGSFAMFEGVLSLQLFHLCFLDALQLQHQVVFKLIFYIFKELSEGLREFEFHLY